MKGVDSNARYAECAKYTGEMQGQNGMNLESVLKSHLMNLWLHRVLIAICEAKRSMNHMSFNVLSIIVTK